MGAHKDHHITATLFRWRKRARECEEKLSNPNALLRATIALPGGGATDVWVPNLPEHEDALMRLVNAVGYGAYTETDTLSALQ